MNPAVAGLAAALAAAGAGALGFWLYWRRKVEGEKVAAVAAAAPSDAAASHEGAAWSVDQAIEDWQPAQAANQSESTTEPFKPIE